MPDRRDAERAAAEGRRATHRLWLLGIVAGMVVYGVLADPVAGVIGGAIQIGLSHLLAAVWVAWRDPMRPRGVAAALLYMAYAAYRTGMAAFAVSLVLMCSAPAMGMIAACFTGAAAMVLSSALFFAGFFAAKRAGVRIWLPVHVPMPPWREGWPPRWYGKSGARRLSVAACITLFFATLFVVVAVLDHIDERALVIMPMLFLAMLGALIAGVNLLAEHEDKVFAPLPEAWWGDWTPPTEHEQLGHEEDWEDWDDWDDFDE